ncbi:MAG: hypothetical protein GY750_15325 [Lentisphaerae bacterium]|nr:hypothetical protein [Lentisphaerota bacterium]MCP4102769.1 hypothetical protein [Lentisphaerota bacterium]
MHWRRYFEKSPTAVKLESKLKPTVREHHTHPDISNTDIKNRIINIDISQPPIKIALSYVHELRVLTSKEKYQQIVKDAQKRAISKSQYIHLMLNVEIEAALFHWQAYEEIRWGIIKKTFNIIQRIRKYLQKKSCYRYIKKNLYPDKK